MRKFVVFCVSLVFAISSFLCAFADDPSPDTSPNTLSSGGEYSSEELEFLSNASDDRDLIIRQSVIDAVRSTSSTYTLDDIYSLLIALVTTQHNGLYEWKVFDTTIYNQINNNFSHYDSYTGNIYDTGAMLWLILSHLNNLDTDFTPALSSNPSMYELTADIDDTLNSLWLAFQAHAAAQINYSSALWYNNIGVAQYAYQTNQTTANVFTLLNNVLRPFISNIDTNISYIKTNSDTLVSNTNTISNTLNSIELDFNNISWSNVPDRFLGCKFEISDSSYISSPGYFPISTHPNLFVFYSTSTLNNDPYILRYELPLRQSGQNNSNNYIKNVVLYYNDQLRDLNYHIEYQALYNKLILYIFDCSLPRSGNYAINFQFNNEWYLTSVNNSSYNIKYLEANTLDYYTVYGYLTNKRQIEHLDIWKELYASDDIIKAKEDQQSYEDQALNDFTGSGSAAAAGSDLTNLKSVSNTIKSGLQSGGSVSNALAPFNTLGGFWGWFTSQNSNDINNPNLQTRDSQFIDFYSDNQLILQNLLGGDNR